MILKAKQLGHTFEWGGAEYGWSLHFGKIRKLNTSQSLLFQRVVSWQHPTLSTP